MSFDKDYLVFDQFGLKEVRCMACGEKAIKSRDASDPRMVAKHADYREFPVTLSDRNIAFLMVCDDCKFKEIGSEEAKKITQQIRNALKAQLTWEGKTQDVINALLSKNTRTVLRKSELSELSLLGGKL